ncbi:MAG TPA: flagellar export chaperone FliS [Clostridia bacterium]|nr:flagellar export chaperone FliS [Clostridia bacterium]
MNHDPRLIYREAAVRSATAVGLVVMLYDVVIEDLGRAMLALHVKDVEKRTSELTHAMLAIQQLQATLQMEQGGEAARNLDRFYSIARAKLLEAHLKQSGQMIGEQLALFRDLRDAWRTVEGNAQPRTAGNARSDVQPSAATPSATDSSALHWSA